MCALKALIMGKGLFAWKKQTKFIPKSENQHCVVFLPNELFMKILDQVSQKDLLNCRLTCWAICIKINNCYLSFHNFHLHEKYYKELLYNQLSFSPKKTVTVFALKTDIPLAVLRLNFQFVSKLVLTDSISQKNFCRLLQCAANLINLKLGSLVLEGTPHLFPNKFLCNFSQGENETVAKTFQKLFKSSRTGYLLPIQELNLTLTYVPCSLNKRFFSNIQENLNCIQHLNVPFLTSLEFSTISSEFQEKYMFSIREVFATIPKCSYATLRTLTIIGPCFHFRHRNDQDLLEEILEMKLQLNNFTLHYETKHESLIIPKIISSFIKTQISLKTVQIKCNGLLMLL